MSFRHTRCLAALLVFSSLAACSTDKVEPEATPALKITPGINLTALSRLCPQTVLDDNEAFKRIYSPSSSKSADNLAYQISLTDYTRSCSIAPSGDELLVQVAVAGRLIGGPKARPGVYNVPIRVEIVDGSTTLYDQVVMQPVDLPGDSSATQFLFKAENLRVPPSAGANTRIRVGIN